jgi:xylulose-5-phosphate/fructose-6-phosphate phosphoketolase
MIASSMAPYEAPFSSPDHEQELQRIDAWWRAANYLAVGMIYLRDNPLLAEPWACWRSAAKEVASL